jgi:hypothetical protein
LHKNWFSGPQAEMRERQTEVEKKIVISKAYIFLPIKIIFQRGGYWVLFWQVNLYNMENIWTNKGKRTVEN